MAASSEFSFVKGHGTGNDFVVIPDLDDARGLSAQQVRFLCDRHTGIGADGVLRVVRSEHAPAAAIGIEAAEFFMDYRNADGSLAEMCGNGARVFVRYLKEVGLLRGSEISFATRGGVVNATLMDDDSVTIDMGEARPSGWDGNIVVEAGGHRWTATGVLAPNPHAVAFVSNLAEIDLREAPRVSPATVFPDGVNVEFVLDVGPDHVAMRVHERGVGETLSCGTGACAVAWAARRRGGEGSSAEIRSGTMRVDVPGGTLSVTETEEGHLLLNGPAVLVASGSVELPWLA